MTPDEAFSAELAIEAVRRTDKLKDDSIELALRLKQAREFMTWSVAHIRESWLAWMDQAGAATKDMNQIRMAFDRETKTIVAAGKDVRDFFGSPEYLQAHATLKETVDLLERFGALKQNGTLDAFAEFILKVTCK